MQNTRTRAACTTNFNKLLGDEHMLDLNHPQTKFKFAIAREDDAVLSIAKRMTLVRTEEKRALLVRAQEHITKMRQILVEGWRNSQEKSAAIDLLQKQIQILATI